ncbi:MAG: helix-turn-helix transcriptional regulator [Burkholderiaceae bacterium]|jgi:predicted ATPase/DNA-binding winged helix-turn-helix (wHTH) protein|nr:helix-turn-helix transcriptional regulator [Burkholderiaceae bacterium]
MDGQESIRFDRFELQPSARRLLRAGEPVRLGARAFDLLALLVAERERTLARDELLERVWPGVVVEPNNLDVQVWALRRAIGTEAIATIPGRGYRFALPVQAPTLPSAMARPAPSPATAPLVRLIGRDADLADLAAALADRRFVTVTGAGGIGKTLLVRHLLHRLAREERRDTCWVELAALADDADVLPAVAAALGVPLSAADPQQAMAAAVAPLQLVVALDNADAVPAGTGVAAQALLARAPGLHVVVTSQAPLRMAGEHVLHLDSLALPPRDADAEAVLRAPAVELLIERVHQLQRGFVLGAAEAAAAAAICRALDGSALAIELAAARVPLLGLAGVAAALRDAGAVLDLPGGERRDAPPRQRSLRAALQWSHGLLAPVQQQVFRGLAVFAGGSSLQLAEAVLCGRNLDRWALLHALDDLAARSLLAVEGTEPPRYRLLEAPLALARERLAAAPEHAALRERHARMLARRLADALHEALAGRRSEDDFVRDAEPELDNARAAFAWALQHDAALAVALARPLGTALTSRRLAEMTRVYDATEPLLPQLADEAVRLHWLLGAAAMLNLREPARALRLAQQACALARTRGDAPALARALCLVATSRDPAAAALQDDALAEALALERADWPAYLRQHLAGAESIRAYHCGDLARCRDATRRQLLLAEAAGTSTHADAARTNLADLELAAGRPAEAVRLGRQLVERWQGTRHARALATARLNLANALLALDDTVAARAVAAEAWHGAALWRLQPYWGLALALLAALEGRPRATAALLGYADEGFRRRGERPEPNEARSRARAEGMASAALGTEAAAEITRLGALLNDEQAGRLGLAQEDGDAALA